MVEDVRTERVDVPSYAPRAGLRWLWQEVMKLAAAADLLERRVTRVELPAWTVAMLAAAVSAYAFSQYYRADLVLVMGDSAARLNIARRVVDSMTPGLAQLGNIWPPVPQFLMLLTVWNDTMWHTGLSGSIPSMIAFVLAIVYLHRTVARLTNSGIAAVLAAALFATNANFLFMQATPATEPLTLLFISGATFHLLRWSQTDSFLHLVLSAVFIFLGTLTRYEAWVLVPAGLIVIVVGSYKRGGRRRAEGLLFAWAPLAAYGIVLWLIYNSVIFHNTLGFSTDPTSASAHAAAAEALGKLPTKHDAGVSIATYGWAVVDNLGWPLVILGALGWLALVASRQTFVVKAAALVSAPIFAFEALSLFLGESVLYVPNLSPHNFYNVRYGLMMLPALAIGAGYFARLRFLGPVIAVAVLVPQIAGLAAPALSISAAQPLIATSRNSGSEAAARQWTSDNVPLLRSGQPVTMIDPLLAKGGATGEAAVAAGWLSSHVGNDDRILLSAGALDEFMFDTGLHLSRFILEGNKPMFEEELHNPGRRAQWIVVVPDDTLGRDLVRAALGDQPPRGFAVAYDDGSFRIFHKLPAPGSSAVGPVAACNTQGARLDVREIPLASGADSRYGIVGVTNNSDSTAEDVLLGFAVTEGAQYASRITFANGQPWLISADGTLYQIGDLAPHETARIGFAITPSAAWYTARPTARVGLAARASEFACIAHAGGATSVTLAADGGGRFP